MKIKIAVTGGPSGGKTTLIEALQIDFKGKLSVVPEAASILYRGGFPRRKSEVSRRHTQKAICFIQHELEDLICAESTAQLIVCDRGSLDGAAYWPGKTEDFFVAVESSREREMAKYQWVIHLDTADESSFDTSNPVRTESHREALDLNEKIKQAWQGHTQRIIIPHESEFLAKISRAKTVIEMIMNGQNFDQVSKKILR
jgi:nicotinamide riboside kinase